jgi:methyl-accepting chemotaxis protein
MDNMTQQNAALVEESAAAAQAMREQAEALARLVGFFRLDGTPVRAQGPGRAAATHAVGMLTVA